MTDVIAFCWCHPRRFVPRWLVRLLVVPCYFGLTTTGGCGTWKK